MIRRFLCRYFSLHDMKEIHTSYNSKFEITRCTHCGLYASREHWTNNIVIMRSAK